MGRGVKLEIKVEFLIILSQHFVQNCLKIKEQNERASPFKIDKNFGENHIEGSDCHNLITVMKLPCQEMNRLSVK